MGKLINGIWHDVWYETKGGAFKRKASQFRNWITPDGKAGPTGSGGFRAEPGRYHLYVSYACPWAHRTLIFRTLKGLEKMIDVSVVHPDMLDQGWTFKPYPGVIEDSVNGAEFLHQIYTKADPDYTGRVTVPVLWDKKRQTIVSNESSEIIRMFNSAFDHLGATPGDYYPESLRGEIDAINDLVYDNINNGVYKAGFATTQEAYEEAVHGLFSALDRVDKLLGEKQFLVGDRITEADWRLFTTLIRFDAVYVGHFKCNLNRIADTTHLSHYLRRLVQVPGIAATVHMDHIKRHYYVSHKSINPTGVIPAGPELDFLSPQQLGSAS